MFALVLMSSLVFGLVFGLMIGLMISLVFGLMFSLMFVSRCSLNWTADRMGRAASAD